MEINYQTQRINFKFLSRKLMMFILTQVLFWSSMFGANSLLFDEKQMMEMYIESMKKFKSNLTDMLCMFSFFGMVHFHPYISVIVARGCSKLPAGIVLARDLKWPKYGYIMATGWVFCILFFTLQFMVMYRLSKQKMFLVIAKLDNFNLVKKPCIFLLLIHFSQADRMMKFEVYQIVGFSSMYAASTLYFFIYHIIHFYVVVWAEKFGEICKEVGPDLISHCKTCLKMHRQLENGLGFYFLTTFSICQIYMIVNLFNVISIQIMNSMQDFFMYTWEKPLVSLSFLFFALDTTGVILSITLTVEKSFKELKKLALKLREYSGRAVLPDNIIQDL